MLPASAHTQGQVPFPSRLKSLGLDGLAGGKLGFSFAFALAENEAISEAVETLSDIVETCKDLYGVASFIQQDEVQHLGDFSSYLHTPVRTPTRSARQSFYEGQRSPTAGIPLTRQSSRVQ